MMFRSRALLVTLLLLLCASAPAAIHSGQDSTLDLENQPGIQAASGRVLTCQMNNVSNLPPTVTLSNQSCLSINLGELTPGSVVGFDISISAAPIDFLVFKGGPLSAYLNEQSYRLGGFWEQDTSLESLSGNGTQWHWQVPTDTSQTTWYVVLDHMAHAGDNGNGGQGGADTDVSLVISFPTSSYWTEHDSLQTLAPGSKLQLLGPDVLTLDEGTEVSISALPLRGNPDVFIMTEEQRNDYLIGAGGNFWISGTELLSITSAVAKPWMVPSEHAGQPLYMFIDNEAGPFGGGDGSTEARATVIVELRPVMSALIGTSDNISNVDVGQTITLDVNGTPNLSNQVDLTLTHWDFDGGDSPANVGDTAEVSWSAPGTHSVSAQVNGPDGRNDTSQLAVTVQDLTNPTAAILGGSSVLTRDVNSDFSIMSTSTDNWMIKREDWRVNGVLVQTFNQAGSSFNHSINVTGNHTIELTVTDGADRIAATTVMVVVRDGTAPLVTPIAGPADAQVGDTITFSASATDGESSGLTYYWDFDKRNDADGDGDDANDVQAEGETVTWTFSDSGAIWVVVTVQNDAGLNKSVDHLIEIEAVETAQSSSNIPYGQIAIVLVILVMLGGGGWLLYTQRERRLEEAELAAAQAAAQEEEEEQAELTGEEQVAMFDTRSAQLTGRAGAAAEMAALAGVDAGAGAGGGGIVSEEALSAFADMTDAPAAAAAVPAAAQAEEEDPIMDDLDFLRKQDAPEKAAKPPPADAKPASAEASPPSESAPAKSGSGAVQLPSSSTVEAPAQESAAAVSAAAPATQPEPTPTPQPEPQQQPGLPTVRAACPGCEQQFAVDMPAEMDEAMVACPKCDQRIKLQR